MSDETIDATLERLSGGTVVWKPPVLAVATTDITLSGGQTVDGVALVTGNRCLVTGQTDPTQNGIYTVSEAGAWWRAVDFSSDKFALPGTTVRVLEGTAYGESLWYITTPASGPISLGTTAIGWTMHSNPHGNQPGGALHDAATSSVAGFMSGPDKAKLDAATASATASTLVSRDGTGATAVQILETGVVRSPYQTGIYLHPGDQDGTGLGRNVVALDCGKVNAASHKTTSLIWVHSEKGILIDGWQIFGFSGNPDYNLSAVQAFQNLDAGAFMRWLPTCSLFAFETWGRGIYFDHASTNAGHYTFRAFGGAEVLKIKGDGTLLHGATTYTEQTAASVPTPPAGQQTTFIDSADHKLKRKDSSGTVTIIG